MFNGFLTAQGIPPHALFDPHRPSESLANLLDFIAREHLHTKISTIVYVKPAVTYVKDLVKLGKARGLLQKFNATELSDKLTDTVNLEVFTFFLYQFHHRLQIVFFIPTFFYVVHIHYSFTKLNRVARCITFISISINISNSSSIK